MRVKVPVHDTLQATGGTGTVGIAGPSLVVCPFIRYRTGGGTGYSTLSAVGTELYQTYTRLYEEVKCIGAKVNISIVNAIGGSTLPALEVITCWDRRHGYSDAGPQSIAEMKASSTAQVYTAVNNSIVKIKRSCYASDLIEKAQWHDCSLGGQASLGIMDEAYFAAGGNPNFFVPALFIGFSAPTLNAQLTVQFQVNVTYYFAFRNPKYGVSANVSMSKSIESPVMRASAPEMEVEDLDLADDEDVQADIIAQELAAKRATVKKTAAKIVTPKK